MEKKEERITIQEVVRMAGVHASSVYRRFKADYFKGAERCECGNAVMIPRSEAERYKKELERNKKKR